MGLTTPFVGACGAGKYRLFVNRFTVLEQILKNCQAGHTRFVIDILGWNSGNSSGYRMQGKEAVLELKAVRMCPH